MATKRATDTATIVEALNEKLPVSGPDKPVFKYTSLQVTTVGRNVYKVEKDQDGDFVFSDEDKYESITIGKDDVSAVIQLLVLMRQSH